MLVWNAHYYAYPPIIYSCLVFGQTSPASEAPTTELHQSAASAPSLWPLPPACVRYHPLLMCVTHAVGFSLLL